MQVRNTSVVALALARARAAFTLVEMLVVVAIIVVLAGIGGAILLPQLEKAKENVAKSKAVSLAGEVEKYYLRHGEYPGDIQTLAQPDAELNNAPPVQQDMILDPWNKPYSLDTNGPKPRVFTQHNQKTISNLE